MKDHCRKGHKRTPDNTRFEGNAVRCLDCKRERERRRYAAGPEKFKARSRSRGQAQGDKKRQRERDRYWANREAASAKEKARRDAEPEKYRLRACERNLAKYGLTIKSYENLLESQGGRCAICDDLPITTPLAVDHDHTTGQLRALLCGSCNRALGLFKDDYRVVTAAADYIAKYQQRLY